MLAGSAGSPIGAHELAEGRRVHEQEISGLLNVLDCYPSRDEALDAIPQEIPRPAALNRMSPTKHLRLVPPIDRNPEPTQIRPRHLDVLEQLRKLGALRTAGALTQGEYEAQRVELRDRLRDLFSQGQGPAGIPVASASNWGLARRVRLAVA
jgi:hypothetical protein